MKRFWISVEDRLPEKLESFLIYDGTVIAWAFLNSDSRYVDMAKCDFYNNVTHWMPLPEPPKQTT
jgi:hypothetical protein